MLIWFQIVSLIYRDRNQNQTYVLIVMLMHSITLQVRIENVAH